MKSQIVRNSLILFFTSIVLSGCGVKQYKPDRSIDSSAWVQIDGSESRRGIPLIGASYHTFLHIWRMYPDTCEAYYYGEIKAKRNKSTRRIPLPAGIPMQVVAVRQRSSSSPGAYTMNHHTDSLIRRLFFVPETGHGYVIKVNDLDRSLYDFTLTEVVGDKSTKIALKSVEANDDCNQSYKDLKRLR